MKKHKMILGNIFDEDMKRDGIEYVYGIFKGENSTCVEKIISSGEVTPLGEWLSDERSELVILLRGLAKLEFFSGEEVILSKGDYLLIKANTKHRVTFTSNDPNALWICVYSK